MVRLGGVHQERVAQKDGTGAAGGQSARPMLRRRRHFGTHRHHRGATIAVRSEDRRHVQVRPHADPGRCAALVDVFEEKDHEQRSAGAMYVDPVAGFTGRLINALDVPSGIVRLLIVRKPQGKEPSDPRGFQRPGPTSASNASCSTMVFAAALNGSCTMLPTQYNGLVQVDRSPGIASICSHSSSAQAAVTSGGGTAALHLDEPISHEALDRPAVHPDNIAKGRSAVNQIAEAIDVRSRWLRPVAERGSPARSHRLTGCAAAYEATAMTLEPAAASRRPSLRGCLHPDLPLSMHDDR